MFNRAALILLLLTGCESPLFNHRNADDLINNDGGPSSETARASLPELDENCPLEFVAQNLCASLQWTVGPDAEIISAFGLKFWDKNEGSFNGPFVDPGFELSVQLWMPSMGHGSSPVVISKVAEGEYNISDVYFNMPGDWDVRVKLKSGNTTIVSVSYLMDLF